MAGLPTEQQFSCRVELSKTGGITIIIKDAKQPELVQRKVVLGPTSIALTCQKSAQVVTTVTLQESSLKTEVKTEKGTTTIEQDGTDVKVTCKTFEIDADTITLKAKQDGRFETGTTCTIKSAQDALIDSAAKLTLQSVQALALDGKANVTVAAAAKLAAKGNLAELVGTGAVAIKSDGTAELAGMTVKVEGQTELTAQAPITTIGKTSTTVKGQIVEITGSLVKVG